MKNTPWMSSISLCSFLFQKSPYKNRGTLRGTLTMTLSIDGSTIFGILVGIASSSSLLILDVHLVLTIIGILVIF